MSRIRHLSLVLFRYLLYIRCLSYQGTFVANKTNLKILGSKCKRLRLLGLLGGGPTLEAEPER